MRWPKRRGADNTAMDTSSLTEAFAAAMDRLGPFEPSPHLAVAVSGGADSMALALLTRALIIPRGGAVLGLVVDHGLRSESADEARLTVSRLAASGIPARLLTITDLPPGPGLAERARIARYRALTDAGRDAGILHLLLGHHALDQAETVAMRVLRGSQTHGLAGMSALRETPHLRLLRPLLGIEPACLRAFLTTHGVAWVEDPSNQNVRALRSRLRTPLSKAPYAPLLSAVAVAGVRRTSDEDAIAAELACRTTIRPEGFALLSPGRISELAFSRLVQAIGAAPYPPPAAQIAEVARDPYPTVLAGVRIMPAGRAGRGFLVLREQRSIAGPAIATPGTVWDRRFRIVDAPAGTMIAALGGDAAQFRRASRLPSAVLRTLPTFRRGETIVAVPHVGYAQSENDRRVAILFSPPQPPAGASFMPMTGSTSGAPWH